MGVNLKKGQGVSLRKQEDDLSLVTIGLGWDVNQPKKGFLSGMFSKKEEEYDLDVVAFLCGNDGKIHDLGPIENGRPTLRNGDIVFYNSLKHHSGHIWLTGDNRTGEGEGDDEQIIVKLNDLSEKYTKIVFIVQIFDGTKRNQSFGKVNNAFIRAVDKNQRELVRFDLSGGESFTRYRSIRFAELVREDNGWKFNAIGEPSEFDSFVYYIQEYI